MLGALVAPTDVVAVRAIAARLGLPQRLMTVLEGEAMLDDATGLVAYRMAVAIACPQRGAEPEVGGVPHGDRRVLVSGRAAPQIADPSVKIARPAIQIT